MRIIFSILLIGFFCPTISAQTPFQKKKEAGIAEFSKPYNEQNFLRALDQLRAAYALQPDDPETNYYLGYAYERALAKDASNLIQHSRYNIEKASFHLEKVIKKQAHYQGKKEQLTPYSKLTSNWGSLALAYTYQGKTDSINWALQEGKKRGGYPDALLEFCRNLLNSLEANAILFSSGDNFTYPLYYLQQLENTRPDVQLIDINLLNTNWYVSAQDQFMDHPFLNALPLYTFPLNEGMNGHTLSLPPQRPGEQGIDIPLRPAKGDYFTRAELVLHRILEKAAAEYPIYFTVGMPSGLMHDISEVCTYKGLCYQFTTQVVSGLDFKSLISILQKATYDKLQQTNANNDEDLQLVLNYYRYAYLNLVAHAINNEDYPTAADVLGLMDKRIPVEAVPMSSNIEQQYKRLKARLPD